jgi:8-oxo-(d)GTP phosphatase
MALWLIRHACAGHAREWDGRDGQRPLDEAGRAQAEALAHVLAPEQPDRVLSSPTRRCVDTVQPLGAALDLEVEVMSMLREGHETDLLYAVQVGRFDGAALCTHGEVLEVVLDGLHAAGVRVEDDLTDDELLLKGAAWRLDRQPVLTLRRYAPITLHTCPHHA